MLTQRSLTRDMYYARFAASARTLHRDLTVMRDAGFVIDGHISTGGWTFVTFRHEPEAA